LILLCWKMNCEWDKVKNRSQTAEVDFLKTELRKSSFRFFILRSVWFGSAFRKPTSDIFIGFCTSLLANCTWLRQLRRWTFTAAELRLWNNLPVKLRQRDTSFRVFRRPLKTFLFHWDCGTLWLFTITKFIKKLPLISYCWRFGTVLFQLWFFSLQFQLQLYFFSFSFSFSYFFQLILQLFDISVTVTVILNINKLDTKHAKYCIQLTSCRTHTSAFNFCNMFNTS